MFNAEVVGLVHQGPVKTNTAQCVTTLTLTVDNAPQEQRLAMKPAACFEGELESIH